MNREPGSQPGVDNGADDTAARQTPGTDMQPEDTGTAESGSSGRGTASEKAQKQSDKTGGQRDGKDETTRP